MITLTDDNFDDYANEPLLVMFTAEFAGPCRMAEPTFRHVEQMLKGEVRVGKFDLDNNPDIPSRYGVKQLPLFVMFVNGQVIDAVAGAVPSERIIRLLDDA